MAKRGRRKRGRKIDGWLAIDKPVGMTSAHVVNRVKRILDARKVGHGGTLDPLATGILPIALGEATKTVAWVMDGTKRYRVTVRFGAGTETDDAEGEVVETSDIRPTDAEIEAALPAFIGEIEQVPPAYSAIKVDGQRAYDLARDGAAPEMKTRLVTVEAFTLTERPDPDHATFEVTCGKGTYVRALARDLARALGTVGHVFSLRRTAVGPFDEAAAFSLEKLEELRHSAPEPEYLLPIETALDGIPALALTQQEATQMANGQALSLVRLARRDALGPIGRGDTVLVTTSGRAVALAEIEGGEVRPIRVFNLDAEE